MGGPCGTHRQLLGQVANLPANVQQAGRLLGALLKSGDLGHTTAIKQGHVTSQASGWVKALVTSQCTC
jgi:hypothetical protein